MFCVCLLDFGNNCPGVGFLDDFSAPGVGVSHFLIARGGGNLPFQKISRGFAQEDGQAWN